MTQVFTETIFAFDVIFRSSSVRMTVIGFFKQSSSIPVVSRHTENKGQSYMEIRRDLMTMIVEKSLRSSLLTELHWANLAWIEKEIGERRNAKTRD